MAKNGILDQINEIRVSLIDPIEEGIPAKYYKGRRKHNDGIDLLKRELEEGLDIVEIVEQKIEGIIGKEKI